jgi:hypothetical protein
LTTFESEAWAGFFGEPEFQTGHPIKFLAFNLPYVLVPPLLLVRMRKPLPFTRKF